MTAFASNQASGSQDPGSEMEELFQEIFVVGASRSGTTLLGRILGRNSAVHFFQELHFFEEIWFPSEDPAPLSREDARAMLVKLLHVQSLGYLRSKNSPVDPRWTAVADEILDQFVGGPYLPHRLHSAFLRHVSREAGCRASVEHTPAYALYSKEILALYPNAKIVHIVRDPRDVLTSQRLKYQRRKLDPQTSGFTRKETLRAWANYHPWVTANLWKVAVQGVRAVEADTSRVLTVRFEDLSASPDKEVERICDFLGLEYSPDMLMVPSTNSSRKKSDPNARGINRDVAKSAWPANLPEGHVHICEQIAGSLMEHYGYATTKRPKWAKAGISMLSLLPKGAIALGLNLERSTNIVNSIRRRFFHKQVAKRPATG